MIYRTAAGAYDEKNPMASWKEKVILKVTLSNGVVFFRTYTFDTSADKCRKCRGAERARYCYGKSEQNRHPATGHVCELCGNPYAGFVRRSRIINRNGHRETLPHTWGSSGKLH
jgi:hypothetical protein